MTPQAVLDASVARCREMLTAGAPRMPDVRRRSPAIAGHGVFAFVDMSSGQMRRFADSIANRSSTKVGKMAVTFLDVETLRAAIKSAGLTWKPTYDAPVPEGEDAIFFVCPDFTARYVTATNTDKTTTKLSSLNEG